MTLNGIAYFLVLEKERSFTKAAAALHLTQQSLSASIAALEKELDAKLFERKVPLELTYAGEVFLDYARAFDRLEKDVVRSFADIAANRQGVLKLGIAYTRSHVLLPDLVCAFMEDNPGIRIEIHETETDQAIQSLVHGDIDLALCRFERVPVEVELDPLYEEEIVLLLPKQKAQKFYGKHLNAVLERIRQSDLSDLKDFPMVLGDNFGIPGGIGPIIMKQAGLVPKSSVSSDNTETQLSLCLNGAGACFCQRNLMESVLSDDEKKQLIVLTPKNPIRYPIQFAFRKDRRHQSIINQFMAFSRQFIQSKYGSSILISR